MTSLTDTTASFGTLHFGAAQLGDVRRTRRLVQAADAIVQHPGGTLPQKLHDPDPARRPLPPGQPQGGHPRGGP